MRVLNNQELNEVNGGGRGLWLFLGGLAILISGIVAGFTNPNACKVKK